MALGRPRDMDSLLGWWDIRDMNNHDPLTGSEFYARLVKAFSYAGLRTTQDAIAELLNVSQASVSKWRNDKAYPSKLVAMRAATLANVSVAWLFFEHGDMLDMEMNEFYKAFGEMLRQISAEHRETFMSYMEWFVKQYGNKANGVHKPSIADDIDGDDDQDGDGDQH